MDEKMRERAGRRLQRLLRNPPRRSIEERAPLIPLKNGKVLMIETTVRGGYLVSLDFGLTCREIAHPRTFDELLNVVLHEATTNPES